MDTLNPLLVARLALFFVPCKCSPTGFPLKQIFPFSLAQRPGHIPNGQTEEVPSGRFALGPPGSGSAFASGQARPEEARGGSEVRRAAKLIRQISRIAQPHSLSSVSDFSSHFFRFTKDKLSTLNSSDLFWFHSENALFWLIG